MAKLQHNISCLQWMVVFYYGVNDTKVYKITFDICENCVEI